MSHIINEGLIAVRIEGGIPFSTFFSSVSLVFDFTLSQILAMNLFSIGKLLLFLHKFRFRSLVLDCLPT